MGNPHHPASGLTGYYAYWNFPVIGSYTTSDTSSSVSCQNSCEADNSCDAWLIGEDDSGAAGRCRLYSELAGVLTFACTQGNYVREPGNYGAVKLRVTDALGTMECDNRTRVDADNEKYELCAACPLSTYWSFAVARPNQIGKRSMGECRRLCSTDSGCDAWLLDSSGICLQYSSVSGEAKRSCERDTKSRANYGAIKASVVGAKRATLTNVGSCDQATSWWLHSDSAGDPSPTAVRSGVSPWDQVLDPQPPAGLPQMEGPGTGIDSGFGAAERSTSAPDR